MIPFSPVPVKSEDEGEKPQLPELHHNQTEKKMETIKPDPDECLESDDQDETSHSSPESSGTDDSDGNWEESSEAQTGFRSGKKNTNPVDKKGQKLHRCSECGKTFSQRPYLFEHKRIHTGEKPFSCSICDKTFTWNRALSQHMKTHSEEKPFSCSVCSSGVLTKVYFKKTHMAVHSRHRPFRCSVCNAAFKCKKDSVRHMTIHTVERPYSCSVCKKAFKRRQTVVEHTKTHFEEKSYSCLVCKAAFKWKTTFVKHKRIDTHFHKHIKGIFKVRL
uniref:C2H2-type domain-containing protein n=1 Tax=Poecilia latipinna TaxID=48699 RepID=A0A3B3VAK1_9TELE